MNKGSIIICFLIVTALLSSCSTQLTSNVEEFARAGTSFSDVLPSVLDESYKKSVRVDSQVLIETRPDMASMNKKERFLLLQPHNDALAVRAKLFSEIKSHSKVLKAYFFELESLSTSTAASSAGEETKALVTEASLIRESIKKSLKNKIFRNTTLTDFIPKASEYIVFAIKSKKLESELKNNGKIIERELAFLEGVLNLLESISIQENNTLVAGLLKNYINKPFISNGSLPSDWSIQRTNILMKSAKTPALTEAKEAARLLRISFIAVMEGRSLKGPLTSLIRSVTKLTDIFSPSEEEKS